MCSTNKAAKPSLFGSKVKFQNLNAECLPNTKPDFKVSWMVNQILNRNYTNEIWNQNPCHSAVNSHLQYHTSTSLTCYLVWARAGDTNLSRTRNVGLTSTFLGLVQKLSDGSLNSSGTEKDLPPTAWPAVLCLCLTTVCARFASAHVAVSHELCGAGFDENKLRW